LMTYFQQQHREIDKVQILCSTAQPI